MSQQVYIVLITTAPLDPNKFLYGLSLTNSLIQNLDYSLFITLLDDCWEKEASCCFYNTRKFRERGCEYLPSYRYFDSAGHAFPTKRYGCVSTIRVYLQNIFNTANVTSFGMGYRAGVESVTSLVHIHTRPLREVSPQEVGVYR